MKRGDIVQFRSDWGTEPTPGNTSIVRRVAKDSSWADVKTPHGSKRVPNPEKYLKIITEPLVVSITDWYLPLVFSILGLDINYFLGKVLQDTLKYLDSLLVDFPNLEAMKYDIRQSLAKAGEKK